jgi:hypothetical protein
MGDTYTNTIQNILEVGNLIEVVGINTYVVINLIGCVAI